MNDKIKGLTKKVIDFRDKRDWKQFHNPKDVAISMALETSELLEHFQWKNNEEVEQHVKKNIKKIGEELADVFYWVLLMSNDLGIDISNALIKKISINSKKYPIKKARGKHTKYNRL